MHAAPTCSNSDQNIDAGADLDAQPIKDGMGQRERAHETRPPACHHFGLNSHSEFSDVHSASQ